MDDRLWLDRPGTPIEEPIEPPPATGRKTASGVEGSLEAGFNSIEIDLFLSQDRIPMVNHDGWLDPARCTTATGTSLEDRFF